MSQESNMNQESSSFSDMMSEFMANLFSKNTNIFEVKKIPDYDGEGCATFSLPVEFVTEFVNNKQFIHFAMNNKQLMASGMSALPVTVHILTSDDIELIKKYTSMHPHLINDKEIPMLHVALQNRCSAEIIKLLIDVKADVNQVDTRWAHTIFDYIFQYENTDVFDLLIVNGLSNDNYVKSVVRDDKEYKTSNPFTSFMRNRKHVKFCRLYSLVGDRAMPKQQRLSDEDKYYLKRLNDAGFKIDDMDSYSFSALVFMLGYDQLSELFGQAIDLDLSFKTLDTYINKTYVNTQSNVELIKIVLLIHKHSTFFTLDRFVTWLTRVFKFISQYEQSEKMLYTEIEQNAEFLSEQMFPLFTTPESKSQLRNFYDQYKYKFQKKSKLIMEHYFKKNNVPQEKTAGCALM